MDKEKTPQTDNTAKIAELETKIALLTSEAEKQKEVIDKLREYGIEFEETEETDET